MAGNIDSALEQGVMHLTFSSEDGLNTIDDAWLSRLDALLCEVASAFKEKRRPDFSSFD